MTENALFADFYEFTMLRAYFELDMTEQATFSLFVRNLPTRRNFLIACGLGELLDEIASLRFDDEQIQYLSSLDAFPEAFLNWLRDFRFSGDIFAMREGTPFFHDEPILEVTAPIAEAQLFETLILNQIGVQTMLASKAARTVMAARGRPVVDFGARRAQGIDAATKGARAFIIGGADSTSNVMSGFAYGLPVSGTMAHSFVEAFKNEKAAFEGFMKIFPKATLLVDTYDTIAGVKKAISLAETTRTDFPLHAIRLDSGDLYELSRAARKLLDQSGLSHVRIVASGGLDEGVIEELTIRAAPIDIFGVGADMAVSADAPALDTAYKLTEYAGVPRMKLSTGKRSLPGRKQVFRRFDGSKAVCDEIALREEQLPGTPLLHPVMIAGKRVEEEKFAISDIRAYARDSIAALPAEYRSLGPPTKAFEVRISPGLTELEMETRKLVQARETPPSQN